MCLFCDDLVELRIETVLQKLEILLTSDIYHLGIREGQLICIQNFYGYLCANRSYSYPDRTQHKAFIKFTNLIHNNSLLESHWGVSKEELNRCIIRHAEISSKPYELTCIKHPGAYIYPPSVTKFLASKFPTLFSLLC